MVDPEFIDAFSDRLDVARIAQRQATHSNVNASLGKAVTQGCELLCVLGGLADFNHRDSVSRGIHLGGTCGKGEKGEPCDALHLRCLTLLL